MQMHSLFDEKRRRELREAIGKNELSKIIGGRKPGPEGARVTAEAFEENEIPEFLAKLKAGVERDVVDSAEPTKTKRDSAHRYFDEIGKLLPRAIERLAERYGPGACTEAEKNVRIMLARQAKQNPLVFGAIESKVLILLQLRKYRDDILAPLVEKLDVMVAQEERFAQALEQGPK